MNIRTFARKFADYPLFSLKDIEKQEKDFHRRRLVEWQQKGYIRKLANTWYFFAEEKLDEPFLFLASNKIYQPSYVSLESALAFYGFIPEAVFSITAVSTRKTATFDTDYTQFSYRKLKEKLFWGYTLIPAHDTYFKMASPEKAILDFFYFNNTIRSESAVQELRLNLALIKKAISQKRLKIYCKAFENKRLEAQIDLLIKLLKDA